MTFQRSIGNFLLKLRAHIYTKKAIDIIVDSFFVYIRLYYSQRSFYHLISGLTLCPTKVYVESVVLYSEVVDLPFAVYSTTTT